MRKKQKNLMRVLTNIIIAGLLGISIFIGCNNSKASEAESIRIHFLPKHTNTIVPIEKGTDIFWHKDLAKDTVIVEKEILNNIQQSIGELQVAQKQDVLLDFRIFCVVNYKDKEQDTLCLGEYFDVYYNGKVCDDDKELLNMIKKIIYQ
jgi:hypothetical protein